MTVTRCGLVAWILLVWVLPARSANLTKIERTIAKEPAYQSKAPRYCLLVFGPEARTRVWLVLDGQTLYVDRDANGDLTGASKRIVSSGKSPRLLRFEVSTVFPVPAKDQTDLYVDIYEDGGAYVYLLNYKGDSLIRRQDTARRQDKEESLRFADRPQDSPILAFDGTLTFQLVNTKQAFVRGNKSSPFEVRIGTPGLGSNAFLRFFSEDLAASAQIAFPKGAITPFPAITQSFAVSGLPQP